MNILNYIQNKIQDRIIFYQNKTFYIQINYKDKNYYKPIDPNQYQKMLLNF